MAGPWADVQNIFGIIPDSENLGYKTSENDVAEVGDRDHISDKGDWEQITRYSDFLWPKASGGLF